MSKIIPNLIYVSPEKLKHIIATHEVLICKKGTKLKSVTRDVHISEININSYTKIYFHIIYNYFHLENDTEVVYLGFNEYVEKMRGLV